MKQSADNHTVPMTSVATKQTTEVVDDVAYYTNQLVNLVFIGKPGSEWVLFDAGMPNSSSNILAAAEKRYGSKPPQAIIISHAHFDHIGSIVGLLEKWKDTPVYAHQNELAYLTGKKDFPTPDTSVEGGTLAKISSVYPHKAIDISGSVYALPEDGSVPHLPEWKWVKAFGHTPGQIVLFREKDGILLSTDAFISVRQDSFFKVFFQSKEAQGPPRYFTLDWEEAFKSIKRMYELKPKIIIPGHGKHLQGEEAENGLKEVMDHFQERYVPKHGKFVKEKDKHSGGKQLADAR